MNSKGRAGKIIMVLLVMLLIIFSTAGIYVYSQLGKIKINRISQRDEDLGITELKRIPDIEMPMQEESRKKDMPAKEGTVKENQGSSAKKDNEKVKRPEKQNKTGNNVINIALFGIDVGRRKYEAPNSDAIMILSLDKVHKKIKLSSIMRDTYVWIDGRGKEKINSAYARGGPQLAIKTLNQNFNMNIRNYFTVNFSGIVDIIDSMGGLELKVEGDEIREINKYMREIAEIKKQKATPVTHPGRQTLNGKQAAAYARIRKVGNGDFDRTERQKEVLMALISKIQSQSPASYPHIISKFMPYVETSMARKDIIRLCTDIAGSGCRRVEWCRFPVNGYCRGKIIKNVWYLVTDLNKTADQMHKYIYYDRMPH